LWNSGGQLVTRESPYFPLHNPIVAAYDFSAYPTIVDVGGGHGGLLAAILTATPTAQGVLYDMPEVVAGAPALLRQQGVEDGVHIESGSFFDSVPTGGDTYILKTSSMTGPISRRWRFFVTSMHQSVPTPCCCSSNL
jgi:hypothetical protein